MTILNAGDVFEMEAKHLKPEMHIIRNDLEDLPAWIKDRRHLKLVIEYIGKVIEENK